MDKIITLNRQDLRNGLRDIPIEEMTLDSFHTLDRNLIYSASIIAFIDDGEVFIIKNRYGSEGYLQ